jgi:hypothetical protein
MDNFTRRLLDGKGSPQPNPSGNPTVSSTSSQIIGKKVKKYEFAGVGALIQAAGVIALWFFPLGTFAGLAMLLIGSSMAKKTLCGECGNRVEKESMLCPHCKAGFLE